MNKKLLLLMVFLAGVAVQAQTVYSLSECREMALRNNKTLAISREEVNKATYEREVLRRTNCRRCRAVCHTSGWGARFRS